MRFQEPIPEYTQNYFKTAFSYQNQERSHNPYDQELRELTSIEKGDLDQLSKSISETYDGQIGTMADDPLRQIKNNGIVVLALASRAAIRGGMYPELAFSMCDSYIQSIEKCKQPEKVYKIFREAEFQYARLVHELNHTQLSSNAESSNSYIRTCKNYIHTHLADKITVSTLAEQVHLTPNYLSTLFHKTEGISIPEYIQQEKIRFAENMLLYSDESYSRIAAYLGFSSQSYFGVLFKKYTGMTPGQYRSYFH